MSMNLSTVASACSEVAVILGLLVMLIKPLRNKLLGLDKLTDALKCQLLLPAPRGSHDPPV